VNLGTAILPSPFENPQGTSGSNSGTTQFRCLRVSKTPFSSLREPQGATQGPPFSLRLSRTLKEPRERLRDHPIPVSEGLEDTVQLPSPFENPQGTSGSNSGTTQFRCLRVSKTPFSSLRLSRTLKEPRERLRDRPIPVSEGLEDTVPLHSPFSLREPQGAAKGPPNSGV
jgi:hypothetical protein